MVLGAVEIKLVLFIVVLSIFATLFVISYTYYRKKEQREKSKISFKEGLDLAELPIATFYCGDTKLHFILDTGSNISYINKSVLSTIPNEKIDKVTSTIGVEGTGLDTQHYYINIKYKNQSFKEEFGAVDFTEAFSMIEKESGIKLHGLLGNKFFEKYKYILDFKDLIAYR